MRAGCRTALFLAAECQHGILDQRTPAGIGRGIGEDETPPLQRLFGLPRSRLGKPKKESWSGVVGSEFGRAREGELRART